MRAKQRLAEADSLQSRVVRERMEQSVSVRHSVHICWRECAPVRMWKYRAFKPSTEGAPHSPCGRGLHLLLVYDPAVEFREAQPEALVQLIIAAVKNG